MLAIVASMIELMVAKMDEPLPTDGDRHALPKDALKAISAFTLKVCAPLYWHDRRVPFPKTVEGASCFVVRFRERLIGITAAHVLDAYRAAKGRSQTLVCQLRLMPFALDDAVIDCDSDLDIATFLLSEEQLSSANVVAIDCRGQWPAPSPVKMRAVSFAGFPNAMIVTHHDRSAVFRAYGALSAIEDVSDRDLYLTYDPERDESIASLPLPPVGLNLSGCSGGPVLMHGMRNGIHRWFPVGMINSGPKREIEIPEGFGDTEAFSIIRVRRLHFLREDGSIERPPCEGWLPRPTRTI